MSIYSPHSPFSVLSFFCVCHGAMGDPDLCSASVCVCMHVSHVVHISRDVFMCELEKRKKLNTVKLAKKEKLWKLTSDFTKTDRHTKNTHSYTHTCCHINKQSSVCKLTRWACCPLLCSTLFSQPENSFPECVCVFSRVNEAPCSEHSVPPSVSEPASPPPSHSAGRSEPFQRCLFLFMFIAGANILTLVLSLSLELHKPIAAGPPFVFSPSLFSGDQGQASPSGEEPWCDDPSWKLGNRNTP